MLSSRFQYPGRRLFFTRARLFFDRIELSGWKLIKKHERAIALNEVEQVEWDATASAAVLHLSEGEPVRLRLKQMERWKRSLDQRLNWSTTSFFPRPASKTSSTARAELPLQELIMLSTRMG